MPGAVLDALPLLHSSLKPNTRFPSGTPPCCRLFVWPVSISAVCTLTAAKLFPLAASHPFHRTWGV